MQRNRQNNSNLPGYENIIVWRDRDRRRRGVAGMPEDTAGGRFAGGRAQKTRANGIEAARIRAHEFSRLYGCCGGVPDGGCLPVLSGNIRDAGQQRGVREDFARLSGCGCKDVEEGKFRCGVSLYQWGRDQRAEPQILVEGKGTNRNPTDGAVRSGLLETGIY